MTRPVGLTLGCAVVALVASAQFVYNTEIKGDTATVTFNSPRVFTGRGITGAPFTADRVSEHTQTLATERTSVSLRMSSIFLAIRRDRPVTKGRYSERWA